MQIIVPAYNVERFVEACLDSALNSCKRYNFIITVVDDGSSDRTWEIMQKYAENPRFELLRQENIKGRYITFLDSDDMLQPRAMDKLLDLALAHKHRGRKFRIV